MACSKVKDLDIDDLDELYKLMKALGVSTKNLKLGEDPGKEMKSRIRKAKPRRCPQSREALHVAFKAKADYDRKRQKFLESYTEAEKILTTEFQEISSLQDCVYNFKKCMEQLKQSEYFLFVTGQTSVGKSMLINLLLGEDILPTDYTTKTSTICEIRYGEKPKIVAHFKSEDSETELATREMPLEEPSENSKQSYIEQISPFVDQNTSDYKKIELFLPHQLLQSGIVIVDSPGIGETEDLDDMVYQYIKQVFSFIYVISAANSDGIQKDTLRKLFEVVKNDYGVQQKDTGKKLTTEEDVYGGEMHGVTETLLSSCALFVANKWDQVEERDAVEKTKKVLVEKLTEEWPSIDPTSQIVYMSVTNAAIAEQHGFLTEGFFSLKRSMKNLITQCINVRLEVQWRKLNQALFRTISETKDFLQTASKDHEKVKEDAQRLAETIDHFEEQKEGIMKGIHKRVENYERDAVSRIREYFLSEEVKARFTSWTEENAPKESSDWSKTQENIQQALSRRFQETLQHWFEDSMLSAGVQNILQEVLKVYFPNGEVQLKNSADDPDGIDLPSYSQVNFGGFSSVGGFCSVTGVSIVLRNVPSWGVRLAVPAVGLMFCLSVEALLFLRRKWNLQEYQAGKAVFMSKQAEEYFAYMTKPNNLSKYINLHLNSSKKSIFEIGPVLTELMAAAKKKLQQKENKHLHSLEQVKDAYAKIIAESCRGHSELLAVTELCSIGEEGLDWREDKASRLGRGTFGDVYQGKIQKDEGIKNVALKVCKKELAAENAHEILKEIETLRTLKGHRHIVQFYGITPHPSQNVLVLVFEKCKGSLADYIFKDAEKEKKSVLVFQWAREISDGLAFIHAKNVVHKDLKPENILLSEENVIKIADVGLAKPVEVIACPFPGACFYMAPEVRDSQKCDKEADIYSFGIILWEMWFKYRAYQWSKTNEEFFGWLNDGKRPDNKRGCNEPPWNHLMIQCGNGNPKKRPTAGECKDQIKRVCSLK